MVNAPEVRRPVTLLDTSLVETPASKGTCMKAETMDAGWHLNMLARTFNF